MVFDQPKVIGQLIVQGTRRLWQGLSPRRLWASLGRKTPDELILAPQDLRTADPGLAQEYYNGIYSFAGRRIITNGNSPFSSKLPHEASDEDWQCALHSFRWLRHLHASSSAISNSHAQSLIRDWIADYSRPNNSLAWLPQIAAQRLISWLCHSTIIIEKADLDSYRQFLKAIGTHIRHLDTALTNSADGMAHLQVRLALAYAALCIKNNSAKNSSWAMGIHEALGNTLSRQIYEDGGHISRCSTMLPEILADLLPLRQTYEHLGIAPAAGVITAIDRIMPAIRFYRHRDGNLARFNGTGSSKQDLIATILRYDDAMGTPTNEATQSGYQRLTGGPTTLIMDVGKPPRGENSVKAHAGCLAFEMSSLRSCFITNCGAPEFGDARLIEASRSTAAHSTATINNTSSCRFHSGSVFARILGSQILAGPGRVSCERRSLKGYTQLTARHDGYLPQFGVWHERVVQLSDDGNLLFGRDRFFVNGGKPPRHLTKDNRDSCAIRFHLHPSVKASLDKEQGAIIISASENQSWKFTCDSGRIGLEESIFFAGVGGKMPTSQIVINISLSQMSSLNWRFEQSIGTRQQ